MDGIYEHVISFFILPFFFEQEYVLFLKKIRELTVDTFAVAVFGFQPSQRTPGPR